MSRTNTGQITIHSILNRRSPGSRTRIGHSEDNAGDIGNHTINHHRAVAGRGNSSLATQPWLGLCPKWWVGTVCDHPILLVLILMGWL
jgi:hypothetical protein